MSECVRCSVSSSRERHRCRSSVKIQLSRSLRKEKKGGGGRVRKKQAVCLSIQLSSIVLYILDKGQSDSKNVCYPFTLFSLKKNKAPFISYIYGNNACEVNDHDCSPTTFNWNTVWSRSQYHPLLKPFISHHLVVRSVQPHPNQTCHVQYHQGPSRL